MLITYTDKNGTKYILDISTSELFFGSLLVGSDSDAQVLTLTNKGWSDISIREISISGNVFSIEGGSPQILKPKQELELSVAFSPTGVGPSTGSIYVDAGKAGTAYIRLYGAGFSNAEGGGGDITGVPVFELASELAGEAALNYENGTLVFVVNDPTLGNNGFYRKVGVSGEGTFDGPLSAYATMLSEAQRDMDDIEKVANGAVDLNGNGIVPMRLGGTTRTLNKLESEFDVALAAKQAAFQAVIDDQEIQEELASDAAADAELSRLAAEGAADHADNFAGFSVPFGYEFSLNDGSALKRMALGISGGSAVFENVTVPSGGVVMSYAMIRESRIIDLTVGDINGVDADDFVNRTNSSGIEESFGLGSTISLSILDSSTAKRASRVTDETGKDHVANLSAKRFDDLAAQEFYRAAIGRPFTAGGGYFRTQFDFVATTGQSNSQGADNTQGVGMFALDALGMEANDLTPGTPVVLQPSTVATVTAFGGETPLLGFASALRRRIKIENLLDADDHVYRPIIANEGVGGTTITDRSKAGAYTFDEVMAAFSKAYTDGQAGSLPGTTGPVMVKCLSLLNVDGETDAYGGVSKATYKSVSIQRMTDFSTDMKAINGQSETPVELLMQCSTNQIRLDLTATINNAGSGGTNGTFALVIPAPLQTGGGSGITATGTFTVAGGVVTAITVSTRGAGYRGSLALTNAAFVNSAGITGASATLNAETPTFPIATAQRELGNESAQHVLVGPYYQFFNFKDYQHSDANGARQTGSLMASAHKAIWIDHDGAQADKTRWNCLQPTKVERQGKCLLLRFDNAVGNLEFDHMPWFDMESNYGFSVVESGGTPMTITNVSLIGPREVLITTSANIATGAKVRYGFSAMSTRTDYYSGGGGNLRDSQGDWLKDENNVPLHNWCIIFSETLA